MNSRIEDLIEIQRVDIRDGVLREFLDSLPGQRESLSGERRAEEEKMAKEREHLSGARKEVNRKERAMEEHEERIRQVQVKLNQVKTNKEYEAALKEIEEQKRKIGKLEEEILLLYDDVEKSDSLIKELEAGWLDKAREFDRREKELELLAQKAGAEHEAKLKEREAILPRLSEEDRKLYESIQRARQRALARADKEICQGCHHHIPAQMYNEVLRGDKLIRCSYCERILVHTTAPLEEGLLELEP